MFDFLSSVGSFASDVGASLATARGGLAPSLAEQPPVIEAGSDLAEWPGIYGALLPASAWEPAIDPTLASAWQRDLFGPAPSRQDPLPMPDPLATAGLGRSSAVESFNSSPFADVFGALTSLGTTALPFVQEANRNAEATRRINAELEVARLYAARGQTAALASPSLLSWPSLSAGTLPRWLLVLAAVLVLLAVLRAMR